MVKKTILIALAAMNVIAIMLGACTGSNTSLAEEKTTDSIYVEDCTHPEISHQFDDVHVNPSLKAIEKYSDAYCFRGGYAMVQGPLFGLIDKDGREIAPCIYDGILDFNEGMAAVTRNGKRGYIDSFGNEAVPCKYQGVLMYKEGLGFVKKDDLVGFVDKNGKEVIPCEYTNAGLFSEGVCPVEKDGKWGYIDREGKIVLPMVYDNAYEYKCGKAFAEVDGKIGIIDKEGKILVPFTYDKVIMRGDGLAIVSEGDKNIIIDVASDQFNEIANDYDLIDVFHEGMSLVTKNGKDGFINTKGEEVIPCEYCFAVPFSEGLAVVGKEGEGQGYIDRTGKIAIPCQYTHATSFSEGLAYVMKHDGQELFIDRNGREVIRMKYSAVHFTDRDQNAGFHEGLALIKKDGKLGFMDKFGGTTFDN